MTTPTYTRLLFLCVANSARSQMAEGLARDILGTQVVVQSAGSQPSRVNPFAIQAMDELGIDIRAQRSTSVAEVAPDTVDVVITLCAEEVCPAFLGQATRLHWPFTDPDRKHEDLSDAQRLQHFREIRDQIAQKLKAEAESLQSL